MITLVHTYQNLLTVRSIGDDVPKVGPEIIYISDVNLQNVQQWNNFTVTQVFLEYIAREQTQ